MGASRLRGTRNRSRSVKIGYLRKLRKGPCFTPLVQKTEVLTTKTLDVAGVEVVEDAPNGKPFAGPFYADQFELLRETLRPMPRRNQYVVLATHAGAWIYRK
jgi:hypothetical protein